MPFSKKAFQACLVVALATTPALFAQVTEPGRGDDGPKDPAISRSMLVFDDQSHFDAVMAGLIEEQELENQAGGREEDDREAPVFQDYADRLGFHSLLHEIEASMAVVTEAQAAAAPSDDPDSHFIKDPYFRGVLNADSEIQVGGTVYRYDANGYYTVDADKGQALEDLRSGFLPSDDEGVDYVERARTGHCCRRDHSKQATWTYADGDRRVRGEQWVQDNGIRVSYGVSTTNLKRVLGIWVRTKADRIGVTGALVETTDDCSWNKPVSLSGEDFNKSKISIVRDGTRPKVKDYFDSVHWAEDKGDSRQETLSMCACEPVSASFTLPSVVDDLTKVMLNGVNSQNESTYTVEIYRTTSIGVDTRLGVSGVRSFAGQVGVINLASFFDFEYLDGEAVYLVRLIVQNSCGQFDKAVRWIEARDPAMHVRYDAFVKDLNWTGWVFDRETAGTTGESRRMEATRIKLVNAPDSMRICYEVHVAGPGWLPERCNGFIAGTTDQDRRMEGIKITLENAPPGCTVKYQAHVRYKGWQKVKNEGELAGTTGQYLRMEALRVYLSGCP
ncbi:MAG: hypothetical protein AAFX50_02260 [Acidobacteriota bacterium]